MHVIACYGMICQTSGEHPLCQGGPTLEETEGLHVPPRRLTQQISDKRSELMVAELEQVALGLFGRCGFASVTVEDIAAEAGSSIRTFYRYFKTKDEVMLVRIRRRAQILQETLAERPRDEKPLRSIRIASEITAAREDADLVLQWIATAASSPQVTQSILGAIHLHIQPVLADFLRSRLEVPEDSLIPKMLAAAIGGIVQEAHSHWFAHGGDLGETISEGLWVLESGLATDQRALSARVETRSPAGRVVREQRDADHPGVGVSSPPKKDEPS